MRTTDNTPVVRLDFHGEHLAFQEPTRILVARRMDEVLPVLAAVEAGVARGSYAAGFLAYEAAPAFDAAMRAHSPGNLPLAWFGLFDSVAPAPDDAPDDPLRISAWHSSVCEMEYEESIRRIHDAIALGETYQVNYTLRLRADFVGSDIAFYHRLRKAQGPGWHAMLNLGRFRILSASPELFFHWDHPHITVRPMKGTMRRGLFSRQDLERVNELEASEKDRAENLMVTDMMRSDLGRMAVPGSIRVERLFEVETYPTLHQMTSTITARTPAETRLTDVFRALFPSASITGAPKVNTMQWIRQLEPEPRGVYCGAIGYVSPGGKATFSVPIRTVTIDKEANTAEFGVGGGVTWDSTGKGEYAEAWLKAKVLVQESPDFDLLETLLLEDGHYRLLARHLERLEGSARHFGFPPARREALKALRDFAATHPTGRLRARLLVSREGLAVVEGSPVPAVQAVMLFAVANERIDSQDPFFYHKTTRRQAYNDRRAASPDAMDVLLMNEVGYLTEFSTGNIAVDLDGRLFTPPVQCGLLAGTFRDYLLRSGVLRERTLIREDLRAAKRVWYLNSVRGWVEARELPNAGS